MSSFPVFLAQVTNAANAAVAGSNPVDPATAERPSWFPLVMWGLVLMMVYFLFFRPQTQARKQQEEKIKSAKTGDKIVTTGGILGVITNVKDTTVIVRIADNVKIEVEKTHIDKITRSDSAESDKVPAAKVS